MLDCYCIDNAKSADAQKAQLTAAARVYRCAPRRTCGPTQATTHAVRTRTMLLQFYQAQHRWRDPMSPRGRAARPHDCRFGGKKLSTPGKVSELLRIYVAAASPSRQRALQAPVVFLSLTAPRPFIHRDANQGVGTKRQFAGFTNHFTGRIVHFCIGQHDEFDWPR